MWLYIKVQYYVLLRTTTYKFQEFFFVLFLVTITVNQFELPSALLTLDLLDNASLPLHLDLLDRVLQISLDLANPGEPAVIRANKAQSSKSVSSWWPGGDISLANVLHRVHDTVVLHVVRQLHGDREAVTTFLQLTLGRPGGRQE